MRKVHISKYRTKYGMNLKELAKKYGVSTLFIAKCYKHDLDIEAEAIIQKTWYKNHTLQNLLSNLKWRCNNPKDPKYKYYGRKGIKLYLDKKDLVMLWNRDKAYELKRPSIDRINSKKSYTKRNCRFIEMEENMKRAWVRPLNRG